MVRATDTNSIAVLGLVVAAMEEFFDAIGWPENLELKSPDVAGRG